MSHNQIRETVKAFIHKNFIFDSKRKLDDGESLLGSGVIDSTGVLELVGFLEDEFDVKFQDDQLVGENFESISKISAFIFKLMSSAAM